MNSYKKEPRKTRMLTLKFCLFKLLVALLHSILNAYIHIERKYIKKTTTNTCRTKKLFTGENIF